MKWLGRRVRLSRLKFGLICRQLVLVIFATILKEVVETHLVPGDSLTYLAIDVTDRE